MLRFTPSFREASSEMALLLTAVVLLVALLLPLMEGAEKKPDLVRVP